jgi:hypothetical protein
VKSSDVVATENAVNTAVNITTLYDFDKDGHVKSNDVVTVENAVNVAVLTLFTVPGGGPEVVSALPTAVVAQPTAVVAVPTAVVAQPAAVVAVPTVTVATTTVSPAAPLRVATAPIVAVLPQVVATTTSSTASKGGFVSAVDKTAALEVSTKPTVTKGLSTAVKPSTPPLLKAVVSKPVTSKSKSPFSSIQILPDSEI